MANGGQHQITVATHYSYTIPTGQEIRITLRYGDRVLSRAPQIITISRQTVFFLVSGFDWHTAAHAQGHDDHLVITVTYVTEDDL